MASFDNKHIYISNPGNQEISVIETDSLEVVKTITVGQAPLALTISHDNQTLFVADWYMDSVFSVNTQSFEIKNQYKVGDAPSRPRHIK